MNMDSRRFRHDLQPNLLGSINCGGYLETIIEDSKVYAKPWFTFAEFTFKADTELLEFICGEKDSQYLVGK